MTLSQLRCWPESSLPNCESRCQHNLVEIAECRRKGSKSSQLMAGAMSAREVAAEKLWLEQRLEYLSTCDVTHEKAITLHGRLLRHYSEWLVFVYDERVPPTNNLAERACDRWW